MASATIIALFAFTLYSAFYGNPISEYMMKQDTGGYLIGKGYKEEDILSIKPTYNSKRNTDRVKGTISYVVFADEPKEKYVYIQWRASGEIQQHCEYYDEDLNTYRTEFTEERKHMETNCTIKY